MTNLQKKLIIADSLSFTCIPTLFPLFCHTRYSKNWYAWFSRSCILYGFPFLSAMAVSGGDRFGSISLADVDVITLHRQKTWQLYVLVDKLCLPNLIALATKQKMNRHSSAIPPARLDQCDALFLSYAVNQRPLRYFFCVIMIYYGKK